MTTAQPTSRPRFLALLAVDVPGATEIVPGSDDPLVARALSIFGETLVTRFRAEQGDVFVAEVDGAHDDLMRDALVLDFLPNPDPEPSMELVRAIINRYQAGAVDADILYWRVAAQDPRYRLMLDRVNRLDRAIDHIRNTLGRWLSAPNLGSFADRLHSGYVHIRDEATKTWLTRVSEDVLARLAGEMDRPLPDSADLKDAAPAPSAAA